MKLVIWACHPMLPVSTRRGNHLCPDDDMRRPLVHICDTIHSCQFPFCGSRLTTPVNVLQPTAAGRTCPELGAHAWSSCRSGLCSKPMLCRARATFAGGSGSTDIEWKKRAIHTSIFGSNTNELADRLLKKSIVSMYSACWWGAQRTCTACGESSSSERGLPRYAPQLLPDAQAS